MSKAYKDRKTSIMTTRMEDRFAEIIYENSPLKRHEKNERFKKAFQSWYEQKQKELGIKS